MEATDLVLGDRYRDTISGWEGVLTGRYEYLNGCVRVELAGAADGKPEGYIFDVQQVERVAVGWVPDAGQEEAALRGERLFREAEMDQVRRRLAASAPRPAPLIPTAQLPPGFIRRFWRWLWDTDNWPAPRVATGGPRPAPPRTGSR